MNRREFLRSIGGTIAALAVPGACVCIAEPDYDPWIEIVTHRNSDGEAIGGYLIPKSGLEKIKDCLKSDRSPWPHITTYPVESYQCRHIHA